MKAQYLNRYNEETKQTEQFYPIPHANAVIGAASKDYVDNALAGVSVTLESMGVTATATELNYVDGVTSNIQAQLNAKANASALGDQVTFTLSGTTLTITSK